MAVSMGRGLPVPSNRVEGGWRHMPKLRILWMGMLQNEESLHKRVAVDQAAFKWTQGLLSGLRDNEVEVCGLTHCYERAWPYGELFPGTQNDFDAKLEVFRIRYPNVKFFGIKDRFLCRKYASHIKRVVRERNIDAVACYNILHPYHVAGMKAAKEVCDVPCFPIILDGKDPRLDNWRSICDGTRYADGVVFLSNWMFNHYPGNLPRLHMDGGALEWYGDSAGSEKKLIVYTGGISASRGDAFLFDVIRKLSDPSVRVIVCGKCDREEVARRAGDDPRVDVRGFVSAEELHEICLRATLFWDTRPPDGEFSAVNFPSKIPNYLSYGKPVVCRWLPSLAEEYREHLEVVDGNSSDAFVARTNEVLRWSAETSASRQRRTKEWFIKNKLWVAQAERLAGWICERIGK